MLDGGATDWETLLSPMIDEAEGTTDGEAAAASGTEAGSQSGTTRTAREAPAPKPARSTDPAAEPAAASPRVTREQLEAALKDDQELSRVWQSEIDRRAAAQANAQRKQDEDRKTAAERQTAAEAARQAKADLVRRAASGDYSAREELAETEADRLAREDWEAEVLPVLTEQIQSQAGDFAAKWISQQYDAGLAKIPELSDPELAQSLHYTKFAHAGDWIVALTDAIAERRTGRLAEAKAKDIADVTVKERLAQARAGMPNPDTGRAPGGTSTAFATKADADEAYVTKQITAAEYRRLRHTTYEQLPDE